jgi:ABC-type Fe3+ transport system permease subunit
VISCYTFPFVFVLVANALDNMPGELEDASAILGGKAWTTARRITIPLALPALVAGSLIAFLQAMTLFGSPAILALPAGFHTMTTKIWSLFQYPPKLELAAAAAVPLLLLTIAAFRWSAANTAPRARSRWENGAGRRWRSAWWCCSIRCSCPIWRCSTGHSRRTQPRW